MWKPTAQEALWASWKGKKVVSWGDVLDLVEAPKYIKYGLFGVDSGKFRIDLVYFG